MTPELKPENFLILERSLSDRLKKRWAQQFAPIKKKLLAAEREDDPLTAHDIVESLDQLEELHKGIHRYIEYVGTAALLFGASRVRPLNETTLMRGPKRVPPAVKAATKVFEHLLLESRKTIKKVAHQMLNEIEKQKVLDHDAKLFKVDAIRDEQYYLDRIQEAGEGTIDIAASLHTSRLSSYGFLIEAEATEITEYQIDEVLDARTCSLCNYMHGKTFKVENALGKIEQTVMVDDPEELKVLAPFFKQTKDNLAKLRTMTAEQLAMMGMDTPPFHPGCRGLLSVAGSVIEIEPQEVTQITDGKALLEDGTEVDVHDFTNKPVFRSTEGSGKVYDTSGGKSAISDGVYFGLNVEDVQGYGSKVFEYEIQAPKVVVAYGDKDIDRLKAAAQRWAENRVEELATTGVTLGDIAQDPKLLPLLGDSSGKLREYLMSQGFDGLEYVSMTSDDHHSQLILFSVSQVLRTLSR